MLRIDFVSSGVAAVDVAHHLQLVPDPLGATESKASPGHDATPDHYR